MSAIDESWIWHPHWIESNTSASAGAFVHFRRYIDIDIVPRQPVLIHITADTRYKLFVNSSLVSVGPVKGDEHQWFYDEVDIQPYLKTGQNHIAIRVLRFYHATSFAPSFVRLPIGGLMVRNASRDCEVNLRGDHTWECAIDPSSHLLTGSKYDDFLHIYEVVDKRKDAQLEWTTAITHKFFQLFGLGPPWKLEPRRIPFQHLQPVSFKALHNIQSDVSSKEWEKVLLGSPSCDSVALKLPAGTTHHVELELDHHLTAMLHFRFVRPAQSGSKLRVTYSESYEDAPKVIPYHRCKEDRCDYTKRIYGPDDHYAFSGVLSESSDLERGYDPLADLEEVFTPFHFRTFRFMALDITVTENADLIVKGIDLIRNHYPLQVTGDIRFENMVEDASTALKLWDTSVRTLKNCMHDCYEDCPFYEQFQYAMDTRSSALFTYCLSGDDRLARQAIIQFHNSFRPESGLTAGRAPSHQLQIIPHFSLYWVCMLSDHFEYYGDAQFIRRFIGTADAVIETFNRRINLDFGLVGPPENDFQWDFVDWSERWKPMGVPPAGKRTGFQTFTSTLYIYTLRRQAFLLHGIGRQGLATEYEARADTIAQAVMKYCYDGRFFTDGLVDGADKAVDYSEQNQIWAVLSEIITGAQAIDLLSAAIKKTHSSTVLSETSIAMRFYTLRALSVAGGHIYDQQFHSFWRPWRDQLAKNVTTWVEDSIFERSDCHAWGCAPLYEFMAEVAGIRPAEPGWKVIAFKPRVSLFDDFAATVPIGGREGVVSVMAFVQWKRELDGCRTLSLLVKDVSGTAISYPVLLSLPGQQQRRIQVGSEGFVCELNT